MLKIGRIHPASWNAALMFVNLVVGREQPFPGVAEEGFQLCSFRSRTFRRRHFARFDPLVNASPARQIFAIFRIESQLKQVQASLGLEVVVALKAVLLKKSVDFRPNRRRQNQADDAGPDHARQFFGRIARYIALQWA